jgi:predicted AAA+ superfamily ATPase
MERIIWNQLLKWKNDPMRKPLILSGARQVGKTYILQAFGKKEYKHVAYLNCDNNEDAKKLFSGDYDIDRIIRNLSAMVGFSILPEETLIILDEIQEVPRGLASLKYFCENARQYPVAVAGSLLGIALHRDTSFPVGKVDIINLYPMNFEEFLMALGKTEFVNILHDRDWESMKVLRHHFIELLRQYYFVGGMPESVLTYVETKDIWKVRSVQNAILMAYQNDVSKHAPTDEVPRINMVWRSIPSQLARDNKKFIFNAVKKGARANDFEVAIQWLLDSGVVYKVNRITAPRIPLSFYEDMGAFKLFIFDCGLMGAMSATPPDQILIGDNVFKEYKGAFTENYVLQQLKTMDETYPYYYSNENSTMEIDFVVQHGSKVIPIEVKAEENLKAKSLHSYVERNPELHGMRLSMSDYREQDWMTNYPLYGIAAALT